ncbi:MAG: ABC transporter ATP-binding protein [Acidobacteriota bacterium]|nr:ABC transporter ATP-binding protein [Acidobacteriota bacterium]
MNPQRTSYGSQLAIVADKVSKVYGSFRLFGAAKKARAKPALSAVSFSVGEGETLGLLGPNGAGKTTLLKILSTMLYPTSGRVLIRGNDVVEDAVKVRRDMGVITCDERSFYFRLTGRQNLAFFAALYGVPKGRAADRIEMLLDLLGLSHAAGRTFHSYSSGMKQKLAIARGLLNEPAIILYDEPTRALDPVSAQTIREWIVGNRKKAPRQTHLLATNTLQEAEQLCDRVIIIDRGCLIASGTIGEIRERWRKHDYSVHRIECRSSFSNALYADPESGLLHVEQYREGDNVTLRIHARKDSDVLHRILSTIVGDGGRILACDSEKVAFEEVFCAMVAGNAHTEPSEIVPAGKA